MSFIPGWDSITGAHTWSNFWFWASIIALILLGVTEVVSHRYSERKDELVAQQERETKNQHDEEMARLHLETSQANSRAEQAALEAARAGVAVGELSEYVKNLQTESAESKKDIESLRSHPSIAKASDSGRHLDKNSENIIRSTVMSGAIVSIIPFMPGEPQDFANALGATLSAIPGVQVAVGSGNMIMNGQTGLIVQYDHSNAASASVFNALVKAGLKPVEGPTASGSVVYIKVAPAQ